ncbi:MAG: SoxR reducing system RseC family protein [Betaproteobacteria bacterium]|nr:SoxR reducing system RseC family protein [Betaproteobacteria bacterium]
MIATEAPARVTRVEGNDAWVVSEAPASCGACGGKGCGSSVFARMWRPDEPEYRVDNPIGAAPGEAVVVGLPAGALLRASLLGYGLPLLLLLAGAGLGHALGGEPGAILGGLCGLALAALGVKRSRMSAVPVIRRRGSGVCGTQ